MTDIDLSAIPILPAGYRIQWEEVQNCHVLLYPEGMVQLNETAQVILQMCDGKLSLAEIISTLEKEFSEDDLSADVLDFMVEALERGWIHYG